jgi:preprotein translocase subunit SecF
MVLILGSLASMYVWGLNLGIDFKGGSLLEVEYSVRPDKALITEGLDKLNLGDYSVRETGDRGFIVRTQALSPEQKNEVVAVFSSKASNKASTSTQAFTEKRFDSIGPILGKEAIQKAWISIFLVLLAIVIFITFVFRGVSKPVSSWKYGLVAILALAHDVIIPIGVFAFLGHYAGVEVDTLFVTALLVILGFSIHDTIVVFDRVRENLKRNTEYKEKKTFDVIVGDSISQTFVRSVNTSLSTLIAVAVLYVWGPESTKHFSLALLIGLTAGTYSSIFIGSPLLVTIYKWQEKNQK